jgi:hypothetical protein
MLNSFQHRVVDPPQDLKPAQDDLTIFNMTISTSVLTFIVVAALVGSAIAPIVFIVLLVRDWRRGQLW